jgi:hypothetical protein
MLSPALLSSLSELPQPVLTVYLDTNPSERDNQRSAPGYMAWLKTAAKSVAQDVRASERSSFREQVNRVERFLLDRTSQQRGFVIFSGPATWQEILLKVKLRNELHWGRPAVSQLVELVDEQKPSCVVVVDRAGARFLRYDLGELAEFPELKFEIDSSRWKRKEGGHNAQRPSRMPHGPQRDAFEQRRAAQYLHMCRDVAEHAKALCVKEGLFSIFLVGSKRLIEPIQSGLPPEFHDRTTLIAEDLARVPSLELQHHLAPKIAEWAIDFAISRIQRLLDGDRETVMGIDETLAQIQNGTVSVVLLARGLEANLRKCVQCGLTNRSGDPVCPSCGGARQDILLSESLPELARANHTELEVIDGDEARPLIQSGGMGGWLRRPRQAYEVPSTSTRL